MPQSLWPAFYLSSRQQVAPQRGRLARQDGGLVVMQQRRVVVTGMGVVSPLGNDLDGFWQALVAGQSGISHIEHFDTSGFKTRIAGSCRDYHTEDHFDERAACKLSRLSQMGIVATRSALTHARLPQTGFQDGEAGVLMGTGFGGQQVVEQFYEATLLHLKDRRNPLAIPLAMYNALSSNISIQFQARGPNLTIATACSSGSNALGTAYQFVRLGRAPICIAGGGEAPLTPGVITAWTGLRVLSRQNDEPARACKPFSKNRDGFVLSEGAAVLILEELASARRRGAPILAEIVGYASGADATHVTAPAVSGQARTIQAALDDAGVTPEQVDYINAHGTATRPNDVAETGAIKEVFGAQAAQIPVSAIKSMIGHSMGASGAFETIACVQAINHGVVPPTINYEEADPECDLDYVTQGARPGDYRIVVNNSFGFGGNNAVLVIRRYEDSP